MKKIDTILFFIAFIKCFITFSQDGRSLILIHNYANKTNIDGIANLTLTEGNIAYNQEDNSIYVYNGTKWIVDSYYKGITTTSAAVPLDENNYTAIITDPLYPVTLPLVTDYMYREFTIKNTTSASVTVGNYLDTANITQTTVPANAVLKIQSDGANWHQVNNYNSLICATEPTSTLSSEFTINNYDDKFTSSSDGNLTFTYGNGSSPDITEIQIAVTDVLYSAIVLTNIELFPVSGSDVDISASTNITSGDSCNNTNFDHLITISGITISDGDQIEINFDNNISGNTDDETFCDGCSIEFYTD